SLSSLRSENGAVVEGTLSLPGAALWWPHTHGAPALHEAAVTIETEAGTVEVDLGSVGFRTIALDSEGDRFALRVNDVEVFCRGACWTSADAASLGGDPGPVLDQARAAGMNMLRVGGTMVYESDDFYAGCD